MMSELFFDEELDYVKPDLSMREKILALERVLENTPGAISGEQHLAEIMPLKHSFSNGIYVREIFIPKGMIVVGRIHKHEHPNFLLQGSVIVATESQGLQKLTAPVSMISPAGTKRALITLEDVIWVTVHRTGETDPTKMVDELTYETYEEFERYTGESLCP